MKKTFNLGIHGIDIRRNERYAYYKPSVAITSRFNSLERLLERICRKAKLNSNDWKENDAILNRTHWLHYAEPIHGSTEAIPLFRLRSRNKISINTETITQALRLTAKRLCASQRADGTYNYTYDAYKDVFDNESFNMVRMAGCAYAVARTAACELTQDIQPLTEASAEKAIRFLLSISTLSPSSNETLFITDGMKRRSRGKLGTSALTLLALQFGNFRTCFALEFILRLQLTEKESFLFSQPALAIGGITGNLNSLKIRNDHDQHAMTAFIAALETPSVIN